MQNKLNAYYEFYSKNYGLIKSNNALIYKYIKESNIFITNYNYNKCLQYFMKKCLYIKGIEFDSSNYTLVFYDIISGILQSLYFRNYYMVKNELLSKKPLSIKDKKFIEHVKIGIPMIFKNKINYRELVKMLHKDLNSEQFTIRTFAYHLFKDNTITSDLIIGAMDNAWSAYSSYWACKEKNIKCQKPKYLNKNGMYPLIFYGKSKKEINGSIKLSTGKYIRKNIEKILGKKCKFELIIDIPVKLKNKKIKMIQINPIYDGHKFKLNFTYEVSKIQPPEIKKYSIDEMISIDLGMVNLMTIYDPSDNQHIIKGNKLIATNEYFNREISRLQSIAKTINNSESTKRIKNLLIKRQNQINAIFNQIVRELYEKYKNKKVIIIGYNENWKKNVSLGNSTNRKFYQIPYRKLLYKIWLKFKTSIVVEVEESYTSKCDALMLEPIGKRNNYSGKRITRGLFKSGSGKLINADLNGAINIMRKYCEKNDIEMKKIKGKNLTVLTAIQIRP